jgi:tetratricopeptide (TPR) repeat protein
MRAKIAYFSGDFKFAEAQLDILKASTSKLISNDAFELALLINENTALDTSEAAMGIFARADFLLYQHQEDRALQTYDSIAQLFPGHSLADDVLFRKGELYERKQQYAQASDFYQKVISQYANDILADNALYRNALLCEEKLGKTQEAMDQYRRLITDFPSSIFVPDARERYRKLRGDAIN